MCQNNLVNIPHIKFCENLSGWSQVVRFRQVGMIRLVVAVCSTNVPSSSWVRVLHSIGRDHWIKFIALQ